MAGLKDLMKKYEYYVKNSGIKLSMAQWLLVSIFIAIALAFAGIIVNLFLLGIPAGDINLYKLPLLIFIAAIDLSLGYPYLLTMQKISRIEENLPDALKQMSDTLRAGGTYEFAIREISTSGYGALSSEMDTVLRNLEEGQSFEAALNGFSDRIESTLVKRTMTIINQSIRAGAGLADVLDDVADDMKELYRIGRERKARTLMQVLFIVMAGGVVAPAIFGMVSQIISFLISSAIRAGIAISQETITEAVNARNLIVSLMEAYVVIEVMASAAMISLMREGKLNKSILYIPFLLFIAFSVYFVAGMLVGLLVRL